MIAWDEINFRGDQFSTDGRFIIGQWVDDDRWRYELRDTQTGRVWEYCNSYEEARQVAETWV